MHRLFRLRHLSILATVLGVGILPIFACHENLGAAGNFAILGDTITTTGATVTVTSGVGRGDGNVGAETAYTPAPPNITTPGTIFTAGDPAVAAAAADVITAGQDLFTLASTTGTALPTDLSTVNVGSGVGVLVPGVYFVSAPATLPNATTLTLSGAGEYVIVVDGSLTFGTTSTVALAAGASAANVSFVADGVSIGSGANISGQILSSTGITVDNATVNGKLLAAFGSGVTLTNTVTVNDAGLPAHVDVTGASVTGSPALSGTGTAADPFVITEGQSLSFTVTGTEPDTTGTVTLDSAGDGALTNYSESNPLPAAGDPVTTTVTYNPTIGSPEAGSTVTLTYTATDQTGAVCSEDVVIFVNQLPDGQGPSAVAGEAPLATGAAGTAADPFIACVGTPLTFNYTTTDPDGGPLTLDVAGETGSFTFAPTLPVTEDDGPGGTTVTTAVTFTPTAADGGNTFTLTFSSTDEFGAVTTEDVVIFASSLPAFGTPFATPQIVTACVGELLQYDIVATDPDTGASLFLYADGVPVGAEHNPNFGGVDTGVFGDLLVVPGIDEDGNDARAATRFQWTPIAGDEGSYVITYTAEDEFGCTTTTTVTVIVTNPPVLSAAEGAEAVIEDEILSVCPGETLTVTTTATDEDGDTIALSADGTPAVPGTFTSTPAPGMVTGTLAFTPTAAEAGNVYTVTVTATDTTSASTIPVGTPGVSQCAGTDTLTFTVVVEDVPTLTVTALGDTVVGAGNVINACSGDAVSFRVRAEDDDEAVTLSQSGAPAGAVFTPGLPTTGDNAAETNVAFTAGAAGSTVITFTGTDAAGCVTTATVTVNVTNEPTLSITPTGGSAVADGATLVACVGTPLSFTVAGNSGDALESVTLTQTGAPLGLTPSDNPLATGTPGASVLQTFLPTAAQGGQTFTITYTATDNSAAACAVSQTVNIRVSSLPVATATPSAITVCEGMPIEFRVRATDTDPGNVTIGTPTVSTVESQPALVLTSTPSLPTAGNPVETVVTATTPDVSANTTYTITYPITDADGCAVSQVVTVTVLNTVPTSVVLTREGGDPDDPFGTEICYTAVVLDNCPAEQGGPNRVAGVQVCFNVVGTTGNAGQFLATTNANGEAELCFTPLFPGTLSVIAVIDQNGDCVADAGTTPSDQDNVTVPAPAPLGAGCYIAGRGKVDASDPIFGVTPVIAQFTIDISPRRNGGFKGQVTSTIPGGGSRNGRRTNVSFRSTAITSVECTEGAIGRVAVVFGTAQIKGLEDAGIGGVVPFRADVLDAGTPGVPNDRFTITLLDPVTNLPLGPVGGNLGFARGRAPKDDILIRTGPRIP